jgi:hypothetical protein
MPEGPRPERLPDFVIIGAAKCGTTSLAAVLRAYDDVFVTDPKEPEFFARDDLYAQGLDSYGALFAEAPPGALRGEASTLYSTLPFFAQTPRRLARAVPDARLIYVLREPVRRAYSFYVQLIKNYQNGTGRRDVPYSFEEAVRSGIPADARAPFDGHIPTEPGFVLAGSRYLTQIEAYGALFGRERMLFLRFEDLAADMEATAGRVRAFLGLPPSTRPAGEEGKVNVTAHHFRRLGEAQAVDRLKRAAGPLSSAVDLLPRGARRLLRRQVAGRLADKGARAFEPAPMTEAMRAELGRELLADRPALEAATGLDLSAWSA